ADLTRYTEADLAAVPVLQPDVTDRPVLRGIQHSEGQPVALVPATLLARNPEVGFLVISRAGPARRSRYVNVRMRPQTALGILARHRGQQVRHVRGGPRPETEVGPTGVRSNVQHDSPAPETAPESLPFATRFLERGLLSGFWKHWLSRLRISRPSPARVMAHALSWVHSRPARGFRRWSIRTRGGRGPSSAPVAARTAGTIG